MVVFSPVILCRQLLTILRKYRCVIGAASVCMVHSVFASLKSQFKSDMETVSL